MIVDTSAIVAIIFRESGYKRYEKAILEAQSSRMSVVSYLEASIVLESRSGIATGHDLDILLKEADIELEPVTIDQAQGARRAWQRFGKGNHPAGLNFGDCFSYALAEDTREPLLFKGQDFAQTDIVAA